jgi:quercetin dioxygenase-like cupin family protein
MKKICEKEYNVLDKNAMRKILFRLTSTEKAILEYSSSEEHYDYHYFQSYIDDKNRTIYKYTFEDHLKIALQKTPHVAKHLDSLPLLVFKHARYSYTPFHVHDFVELNYVYKGSISIIINDQVVRLKEGDVCLLDTEVSHRVLDTGEDDILINFLINKEYFSLNILSRLRSNSIISKFVVDSISETQSHDQYIVFYTKGNLLLFDAVEGLLCKYYDPMYYSTDTISSYLIILFFELLKAHQEEHSINYKNSKEIFMIDIMNYMEDNHQDCTLNEVAQEFGFNPSYLSRYIKKHTHEPTPRS